MIHTLCKDAVLLTNCSAVAVDLTYCSDAAVDLTYCSYGAVDLKVAVERTLLLHSSRV